MSFQGKASAASAAQQRRFSGLVLVAEDDAINQKVIGHQLVRLGLSVDMTSDGAEALARWRSAGATQRHDLLLTDLRMPGMDGYTLASTIRSEETADSRIPIVALSGGTLRTEIGRVRAAGIDDFLTKPVRSEQMGDMVERWLPSGAGAVAGLCNPADDPVVESLYVYDDLALEQMVGDDVALRAGFCNTFVISARNSMTDMHRAAQHGDSASVEKCVRNLRVSAQTVGAVSLVAQCDLLLNGGLACDSAEMYRHMTLIERAVAHAVARFSR